MKFILFGIGFLCAIANATIALPDMPASEFIKWTQGNELISPLKRPSASELDPTSTYISSGRDVFDGKIFLTVFLNNNDVVDTEALDYRPNCYFEYISNSKCRGTIRFEKAEHGDGHLLIERVFGEKILADFLNSKFIDSSGNSTGFLRRWYAGDVFNYETSHYQENTISHFIVVSKKLPQAGRIQEYKHCEKNPRSCGP